MNKKTYKQLEMEPYVEHGVAKLRDANLDRADLSDANLSGADLTDAFLSGINATNLRGCPSSLSSGWVCENNSLKQR